MTSDKQKAFWLGIFVIIAICVVAWLFLFLKPTVGDGKKTLKIRFTNIEGVTIGTRITFGGKAVGTVTAIKELYDARTEKKSPDGSFYFYEVVAKVDSKVKIYNYDRISYVTQGLLGEKSIEITPLAARKGSPPPHEVTTDILYADSGDQLGNALKTLNEVAATFQDALQEVTKLLQSGKLENTMDSIASAADRVNSLVEETLRVDLPAQTVDAAKAVARAMESADAVFQEIIDSRLVDKFSSAVSQIESVSHKIFNGEGTLGRLINSDAFYLQVTATMCKLETVLSDISNYGLLFQYDKKWQRQRLAKMRQMEQLCTPEDFTRYFNQEMGDICVSLDRVSRLLCEAPCRDECFSESFRELMGRVEHLLQALQNYNQTLQRECCP
ncbi:MAG: MCE family protein [Chlamydiales bacterium]|nr:MCE family protein [Chlamydiales bacterium]